MHDILYSNSSIDYMLLANNIVQGLWKLNMVILMK